MSQTSYRARKQLGIQWYNSSNSGSSSANNFSSSSGVQGAANLNWSGLSSHNMANLANKSHSMSHFSLTFYQRNVPSFSGWRCTYPSKKYESQLGIRFPTYGYIWSNHPVIFQSPHVTIWNGTSSVQNRQVQLLLCQKPLKLRHSGGHVSGCAAQNC